MRIYIFLIIFCCILFFAVKSVNGMEPPPSATVSKPSNLQLPGTITVKSDWIEYTKDIMQILFWITLGTISVLTYLRAKKTILQPIRTEIFKVQLEEMRTILSLFVGKGEIELRQEFGLDKLFRANTLMMFDEYASTFFDLKVDREKRLYSHNECPISLITEEGMMKYFELADDHLNMDKSNSADKDKDPRVHAALWAGYTQYHLCIPREFSDQEKKIQNLLENPLLPSGCVKLLNEYTETVHKNLELTRKILTESAKEMPDKYPSLEDLKNSSFDWLTHRFADEFVHLKPKADAVIVFVRSCYDVDNLLQA